MKIVHTLLLLCLLCFCCGCYESEVPLSDASGKTGMVDSELLGVWTRTYDGRKEYLHISQEFGPAAQMRLIYVFDPLTADSGTAGADEYRMFPTLLTDDDGKISQRIMNVVIPRTLKPENAPKEAQPSSVYWYYRYEIQKGNQLVIWSPGFDSTKSAITSGRIKGTAAETTWGRNIKLTDTSENILHWISHLKPGRGLEEFGRYTKINEEQGD